VSITNYAELQAAIADWLARPGDPTIVAAAPDFIRLAESRINFGSGEPGGQLYSPPLRVRQMEVRATAALGAEYIALPSDFADMREIKINTSPEQKLAYVTPQNFAALAASHDVGTPTVYTIVGNELRFGPVPSGPLSAELVYHARVPSLSDSTPSNWLLALAPDVYLFAALVEAGAYVGDESQLLQWFGRFAAAAAALQAQDRRARHGALPLIMRPVTATP
jgi:hypothetical protein